MQIHRLMNEFETQTLPHGVVYCLEWNEKQEKSFGQLAKYIGRTPLVSLRVRWPHNFRHADSDYIANAAWRL